MNTITEVALQSVSNIYVFVDFVLLPKADRIYENFFHAGFELQHEIFPAEN